jgi:hypothetical protein
VGRATIGVRRRKAKRHGQCEGNDEELAHDDLRGGGNLGIRSSAFSGLAAASADAMSLPPIADQAPPAITLTAGGCGIGFHRGSMGRLPTKRCYYGYRPYASGYGYRPYGFYGRQCWWRGGVRVCA